MSKKNLFLFLMFFIQLSIKTRKFHCIPQLKAEQEPKRVYSLFFYSFTHMASCLFRTPVLPANQPQTCLDQISLSLLTLYPHHSCTSQVPVPLTKCLLHCPLYEDVFWPYVKLHFNETKLYFACFIHRPQNVKLLPYHQKKNIDIDSEHLVPTWF